MNLLVVRHAIAEDPAAWSGRDDSERPLTREGQRKMKKAAKGLRTVVDALDVLATSPFIRARKTAEILSAAYDDDDPVIVPALAPGQRPEALADWLATQLEQDAIAVVGHEPGLSVAVSWLIAGVERPVLELKKGAACLLAFPERVARGAGTLLWALTPAQLRRLGD